MYILYHRLKGIYYSETIPQLRNGIYYVTYTDYLLSKNIYLRTGIGVWLISVPHKEIVNSPTLPLLTNWRMIHDLNKLPKDLKMKALLLNIPL